MSVVAAEVVLLPQRPLARAGRRRLGVVVAPPQHEHAQVTRRREDGRRRCPTAPRHGAPRLLPPQLPAILGMRRALHRIEVLVQLLD